MSERARRISPRGIAPIAAILTGAAVLLCIVSIPACHGGLMERLNPLPPAANPLAGEWHFTSTITTNTCDPAQGVAPIQGNFTIPDTGTSFPLSYMPCPCQTPPWGSGTTDGRTIVLHRGVTTIISSTCSMQIDEDDSGIVDSSGLGGGVIVTVSAIGDCGPGLPCYISGSFTAQICSANPTACLMFCPMIACTI